MILILLCLLLALAFAHLADRADARRRIVTLGVDEPVLPLWIGKPTKWRQR